MRLIALSIVLAASVSAEAAAKNELPPDCRQCLVVVTNSWESTRGQLTAFERTGNEPWHHHGDSVPLRMGKAGLAWGRGLLSSTGLPGPRKVESDNKSPAGVFRLASAFGYAAAAPATKMPYLPLTPNIFGVDDAQSRYYNQLLDVRRIPHPDWRTAEKMILADNRYKWGIVVEHNVPPQPGAGSCIFLHVWKNSGTATTGCTAMPEPAMIDLIRWLDPARHPLLIQLPSPLYRRLLKEWALPAL